MQHVLLAVWLPQLVILQDEATQGHLAASRAAGYASRADTVADTLYLEQAKDTVLASDVVELAEDKPNPDLPGSPAVETIASAAQPSRSVHDWSCDQLDGSQGGGGTTHDLDACKAMTVVKPHQLHAASHMHGKPHLQSGSGKHRFVAFDSWLVQ